MDNVKTTDDALKPVSFREFLDAMPAGTAREMAKNLNRSAGHLSGVASGRRRTGGRVTKYSCSPKLAAKIRDYAKGYGYLIDTVALCGLDVS